MTDLRILGNAKHACLQSCKTQVAKRIYTGASPHCSVLGMRCHYCFLSSIHLYLHIQLGSFSLLFLSCTSVDLSKFNQVVNMGLGRSVSELNGYRPVFLLCP